jgi:hypothetical protein
VKTLGEGPCGFCHIFKGRAYRGWEILGFYCILINNICERIAYFVGVLNNHILFDKTSIRFNLIVGEGINDVIEKTTDSLRTANEYLIHVIDKYVISKVTTQNYQHK